MAVSRNPTRTRTIERAWLAEINRRWSLFKRRAVSRLRDMNQGVLVANAEGDPFTMDASQRRVYMVYLERQIDELLLGPEATSWQARYQLESYRRGLETTRAALLAQGAQIAPTEAERLAAQGLTTFTATPALGAGAATAPIHVEALEFLTTRAYTDLKGWTDGLAKQTRQILFDGVTEGKGIDRIVREMTDRIDVSRTRARVIARTEVNQAYGRSASAEAQRASAEIGEPVNLRWLTVRDARVRHLHASWHGKIMTPEQFAANKNRSPWNCRCGAAPVIAEADTEAKRERFTKERELLLDEEAEQTA